MKNIYSIDLEGEIDFVFNDKKSFVYIFATEINHSQWCRSKMIYIRFINIPYTRVVFMSMHVYIFSYSH